MSISYGGDNIQDTDGGVLRPISSVMRNRIINGAMVIDQRNAGASVTANDGTFVPDRFRFTMSASSKGTCQQQTSVVPVGFSNALVFTSTAATSLGSTDFYCFEQYIEGFNVADLDWGSANAKTVTLSFQVRSSLTGTFGGSLQNGDSTRSYPFTYTIASANTWTTASVTIAGDTTGTWLKTNGTGIKVCFGLGTGSTRSGTAGAWASAWYPSATGATSVVGTSGATFYITGVQLEVGSSATSFEYRQYGTELALCQRYYQLAVGFGGTAYSGTDIGMPMQFKTEMRSSPTLTATAAIQITYAGIADYTQSSANATTIAGRVNTRGVLANATNFTGLTNGIYHAHNVNVNNASIALNAEL